MTAGGCSDARICLGAYVLGALDPAERGRVDTGERHVAEQAEDDQRADREPQPLLEVGRLGELGKVEP